MLGHLILILWGSEVITLCPLIFLLNCSAIQKDSAHLSKGINQLEKLIHFSSLLTGDLVSEDLNPISVMGSEVIFVWQKNPRCARYVGTRYELTGSDLK